MSATTPLLEVRDLKVHYPVKHGVFGATRQWVSMNIEKFRKRGLIEVRDRRLIILQRDALRAIAGC